MYNYVDLFAGCGGLSLGIERSGGKLQLAVEKSDMAAYTFYAGVRASKRYRVDIIVSVCELVDAGRGVARLASQPARIRPLTDGDAEALRALRLRAVRQEPDPFASAYEDERRRTIDDTAAFLRSLRGGDGEVLGLFVGTQLLGMVGLTRLEGRRVRHRVTMFSMYVAPEARRRGHARALLGAAIANARTRGGVEQLELTVAATSEAARELYLRAGFTVTGRLANALKDDDRHLDEELLMLVLGNGR